MRRTSGPARRIWSLVCTDCGAQREPGPEAYLCPACSAAPRPGFSPAGVLRVVFAAGAPPAGFPDPGAAGLARWAPLLPLASPALLPPLPVGPSPLIRAGRLGAAAGAPRLWIKDDTGLPTGSLKDRASALVVAKAVEYGRSTVTTASTGNAAVAMAAMCAAAGLRAVIFCPASAPPAKLAQMLAFGATVLPVDGTYDDAYALSIEATREFGWYNRSTAYNPFTIEGKKTVAFEIREQLGGRAPDAVVVPTGDGVILAGVHKGFADLRDMGLVTRVPRLIAAQAEGSAAIGLSLSEPGDDVRALDEARTLADSIRVAIPAAGRWAKRAIRETGGAAVTVSDDEILRAIGLLGSTTGIFAEPASAAAIAAVVKGAAGGAIGRDETVVALVTGTGLKDVAAAMRIAATPRPVEPTIDAVRRRLDENGWM